MALNRSFTTSHAHFWWPRRKDGEADYREEVDGSHPEPADDLDAQEESPFRLNPARKAHSERIYIVGCGNLGAFVAHTLAGIPARPPITLLLKLGQARKWEEREGSIDVTAHGMTETRRGFDVEYMPRFVPKFDTPDDGNQRVDVGTSDQPIPEEESTRLKERAEDAASFAGEENISEKVDETTKLEQKAPTAESAQPQQNQYDATMRKGEEDKQDVISKEQEAVNARFARNNGQLDFGDKDSEAEAEAVLEPEDRDEIISHLIVTVKAPHTINALQALAHRLTKDSSVLFLQNGMGIIDEVNKKLFPNEKSRPTYIVGVVSHGLYSKHMFEVTHAGEGTIALGVMSQMPMSEKSPPMRLSEQTASARYIMRTMTRTPLFVAVGFNPTDLLQQQLDKIAVNCIINPLTALFDIKNGDLLGNFHFTRVLRLLLAEISIVIRALPELQNVPNVNMRYDTLRLERLVFSIANVTAANYSSMWQDVQRAKKTEVDYINGYIVKRGEEMGLHCVMNYMLVHMIKAKGKTQQPHADPLPLEGFGRRR